MRVGIVVQVSAIALLTLGGCIGFNPDDDVAMLNKRVTVEERGQSREFRTLEQCKQGSWGVTASVVSFDKVLTFNLFNRRRVTSLYRISAKSGEKVIDWQDVAVKAEETTPVRLVVGTGQRLSDIDFLEAEYNCSSTGARGCACQPSQINETIRKVSGNSSEASSVGGAADYEVAVELIE